MTHVTWVKQSNYLSVQRRRTLQATFLPGKSGGPERQRSATPGLPLSRHIPRYSGRLYWLGFDLRCTLVPMLSFSMLGLLLPSISATSTSPSPPEQEVLVTMRSRRHDESAVQLTCDFQVKSIDKMDLSPVPSADWLVTPLTLPSDFCSHTKKVGCGAI